METKIHFHNGMLTIDGDEISYGNIKGMYKTGNGHGLQLSERLQHKEGEILDICSTIADKLYELEKILQPAPKPKINWIIEGSGCGC
jgi:hypothetical protein